MRPSRVTSKRYGVLGINLCQRACNAYFIRSPSTVTHRLFCHRRALILRLANSNNEAYSNKVQQSLHRSLAHNMIEDNALLKSGRIDQTSLANTFTL